MPSLKNPFIVVAVILFVLAALPLSTRGVSLGWLGLAFFAAAQVVP